MSCEAKARPGVSSPWKRIERKNKANYTITNARNIASQTTNVATVAPAAATMTTNATYESVEESTMSYTIATGSGDEDTKPEASQTTKQEITTATIMTSLSPAVGSTDETNTEETLETASDEPASIKTTSPFPPVTSTSTYTSLSLDDAQTEGSGTNIVTKGTTAPATKATEGNMSFSKAFAFHVESFFIGIGVTVIVALVCALIGRRMSQRKPSGETGNFHSHTSYRITPIDFSAAPKVDETSLSDA